MIDDNRSILSQIKRNAVALISLVIAISSLAYNTWRNEQTEVNRNQRIASFEVLLKLNELQQVIFHHHYDNDALDKGNPRTGWTYVLTVRDLSRILHPPLPKTADKLLSVWNENWEGLGKEQSNVDSIIAEIDNVRSETLLLLESLE
jgi:hypothetical protein